MKFSVKPYLEACQSTLWLLIVTLIAFSTLLPGTDGQTGLKATFLPDGDMSGFTIHEATRVGSTVYQLKASNPGRGRVSYYISGDTFSVNKDSGVVTLIRPLDREKEATLDVIITIVEDSHIGSTLSVKREIKVEDDNDNSPVFHGTPYRFSISESTKVFTTIVEGIKVSDADWGSNAQINVICDTHLTPEACAMFNVHSTQTNDGTDGNYLVSINLKGQPLNYETQPSYTLALRATDRGELSSLANVSIQVIDVQDEPPKFLNGPYSITVNESTPTGTNVLTIIVRDGDSSPSIRRDIRLEILDDVKRYFNLTRLNQESWALVTGNNLMDREDPEILLNGGIYGVTLKATEIIGSSSYGAISNVNVTVVIQDVNDQEPRFNLNHVSLEIPEDITNGSAIPGLNLIVSDLDAGHNAKFSFTIQDLDPANPASQVFTVSPNLAMGRTPVIIKVINSNWLDFEDKSRLNFIFNVIASQDEVQSSAFINLTLADSNDNYPIFERPEYFAKVAENVAPGNVFFTVAASDQDSGRYGSVSYTLKGFGSEKFRINPNTGQISVAPCDGPGGAGKLIPVAYEARARDTECLDYEAQPSYSLRVEATDGGGKRSTANLHVNIVDINDNVPKFLRSLYVRELYEKDTNISPPLVLRATDEDGPAQGGNNGIRYRIKWTNLTGLAIDPVSGEVRLTQSIQANFTRNRETGLRKKLNYEAIVEAVDGGQPPLSAEATIQIYVRSERDGEPLFVNEPFNATVKENAQPGTVVIQVKATDPDGPDAKLRYSLINGAKDNFVVDPVSGEVKVSASASLDRDLYGEEYTLTIAATDSGHPVPLTSTATLTIIVEDVNNKPPKFAKDTYVAYLSEQQFVPGYEILQAQATDPDLDAKIRYEIDLDKMKVHDKTGSLVFRANYFNNLLKIDPVSGVIRVASSVDPERASVIVVPIIARDINAHVEDESATAAQRATAELTIYIQSHGERNPIFIAPWTPSEPTYEISLPEETLLGTRVFTLAAKNPITGKPITNFRKIENTDPDNYFAVNKLSGVITLNKRIDFERIIVKQIKFSVEAVGDSGGLEEFAGEKFTSIANILVTVIDINDNSPIFSQDLYRATIMESAKWPQTVLTVQANDRDSGRYGEIAFSVSGDGSDQFEINNRTGAIRIKQGVILDRETKASYNLQVTAMDNVGEVPTELGSGDDRQEVYLKTRRKTTVFVRIDLLDVNDNPPRFSRELYEATVPESVNAGTRIGSVSATDPDEGNNGLVHYEISFLEDFPNPREELFRIDADTGEIFVTKSLSGKGRPEPYILHITGQDSGREPFSSHTKFAITIGDIAANDGIPRFVRPAEDEVIFLTENAKPDSFVYQVEAVDADTRNSPNGRVMYKFAEPSPYFEIDSVRGIITTSRNLGKIVVLDREKQENYTLILIAFDLGSPPQESQRVLTIRLNDTDDNQPRFRRFPNDPPMIWEIDEELPIGSEIGLLKAIDEDTGLNAMIVYHIIYESVEGAVTIESKDNVGHLKVAKRLDREEIESIRLIVQARSPTKYRKILETEKRRKKESSSYQANDLSQVEVKILLKDIDDNPPKFDLESYVIGSRWDIPIHSELVTFNAKDPDPTDNEETKVIEYSIKDAVFTSGHKIHKNMSHVFDLGRRSGVLRNDMPLKSFVGGHFTVTIAAEGVPRISSLQVDSQRQISLQSARIFVLREKDFVKFIFNKSPPQVESNLKNLKGDLQKVLETNSGLQWNLNFQESHFHERKDGSLDFESTAACFQVLDVSGDDKLGNIVAYSRALKSLKNSTSAALKAVYSQYGIVSVEECIKPRSQPLLSKQEFGVVLVAIFIACFSLLLAILAYNMKKDLKHRMKALSVFVAGGSQLTGLPGPGQPIPSPGQPGFKGPGPYLNIPNHDRIYEWQEALNNQLDALSARSFPTLR